MSVVVTKCVFCENDTSAEKVVFFTKETLTSSHRVLTVRTQFQLKYNNVKLPAALNEDVGYHATCYRNFLALQKKYHDKLEDGFSSMLVKEEPTNEDRQTSAPSTEQKQCFFCNRKQKNQVPEKYIVRTDKADFFSSKVKEWAESLYDSEMLQKINSLKGKEISYHDSCKTNYKNKLKPSNRYSKRKSGWNSRRDFRLDTYKAINKFIVRNVIKGKKSYLLSTLCKAYDHMVKNLFYAHGESYQTSIGMHCLEENIKKAFDGKINISHVLKKKIIAPKEITVTKKMIPELEENEILLRAAMIMRERVLCNEGKNIPKHSEATSTHRNNLSIPEELEDFFRTIACGANQPCYGNADCSNQSKKFAEDIFKKVINNVNCYGYCCNSGLQDAEDEEVEDLITEVLVLKDTKPITSDCERNREVCNGNNPAPSTFVPRIKKDVDSEGFETSRSKDDKEAELPIKKRTCDIAVLKDEIVVPEETESISEPPLKRKKCHEETVIKEEITLKEETL